MNREHSMIRHDKGLTRPAAIVRSHAPNLRTFNDGALLLLFLLLFPGAAGLAQAPDRTVVPATGPVSMLKLPPVQHLTLSNGVEVVLMEKHDVPLVQVNLLVHAGSAEDPAGRGGVAEMTAEAMMEGAGGRSSLELADAVDFLGAALDVSAGYHTMSVQLFTPLSRLDDALPLLADVALRPDFPAAELERLRKQKLTSLLQWYDDPGAIASVLFARTLYGNKHPYGLQQAGTPESITAMSSDDLRAFHRRYFRPGNATLIVVGDITAADAAAHLESYFASWPGGGTPPQPTQAPAQQENGMLYLVDKPGAAQSIIRIGRIGTARHSPDYFPLLVMNTILGGSFTSRLNQNLREQHGYTYGAGSSFSFLPVAGPFVAASSVQTEVTGKALAEFFNEFRGMVQEIPLEELDRARNNLAYGYPERFQTVTDIAGQLTELVIHRLPDDTFTSFIPSVLAVTPEQVADAAKRYLVPSVMDIVVVGDRAVIEKDVQALGLGTYKALNITDVLGGAPRIPR